MKERSESRKELGTLVEEKFQQMYRPDFSKFNGTGPAGADKRMMPAK
jgi:hypothetical protein